MKVRSSGGSKLARKLSYLASELASSDFKPTNQQLEVQQLLEERLATFRGLVDALRARDLFRSVRRIGTPLPSSLSMPSNVAVIIQSSLGIVPN